MKKTVMAVLLLACLMCLLIPAAHAVGPVQATLTVKQVFTGAGVSAPDKAFSYRLTPKLASNPMPSATVGGAGSGTDGYTFTITGTDDMDIPIAFTRAGQYTYELRHITPPVADYTYDQEVYTVEIYVQSDLVVVVIVYKKDGGKASDITYEHAGPGPLPSDPSAMMDPPVVKTVSGNPAKASAFTFRLTAGDPSNPMPAGSANGVKDIQITGSGRGEFGTWSYRLEGTYFYTVSEVNTGASGYTYDTTVYALTDAVKAADGQLVVTRIVTNGANKKVTSLSFINTYASGGRVTAPGNTPENGPKTGDDAQIVLYIALFSAAGIAAMASVIYLLAGRRRGKETDGTTQLSGYGGPHT